ncbi:MAG: TSUP family transporter [Paracoccaceae bacterium]
METSFLLASVAVALAAAVQAAVGIGFAMVAVPLLALVDLSLVPGPSILAMLGLSTVMAAVGRRAVDRRGLGPLVVGVGAGTLAAAPVVALAGPDLGLVFALAVLAALALGRLGLAVRPTRTAAGIAGGAAGLMGTVSGIHGPPLVVLYARVRPEAARATIAAVFTVACCLSLIALALAGRFGTAEALAGVRLWPGVAAGYLGGRLAARAIPPATGRALMESLAALSALLLAARSLS